MLLLRIANLDKVWIEAELYEAELPLVEVGQPAAVTLSYLPDKRFTGKITFVYPYLSGATRTGKVRIELDNDKVELKPDMYANVELSVERGERLVVPESAVIYAGPRRLVFVDLGEGKLRPQEIEVGVKTGDWYEVRKGLSAGQKVVTSGNFLVAAESRLKSASGQW
jgi:Cu(I)/Ag(I) efflux system membrane fusion protein